MVYNFHTIYLYPIVGNANKVFTMRSYIPVLTIAGSDCSGGAGIQADIKTISAIGCYAMSVITAITAQNTTGVTEIVGVAPEMVVAQLETVWADIPPLVVKSGMLYSEDNITAIAKFLYDHRPKNFVMDPVMVSSSGSLLVSRGAVEAMKSEIFPMSSLVTPNVNEARELAGSDKPEDQINALRALGCRNILLKGGDSKRTDIKTDYLVLENDPYPIALKADAVDTRNTHGTGCTLSAAIASRLALGEDMETAVSRAKLFVTRALSSGANVKCGEGHGPVNHLFSPRKMKFIFSDNYRK